MVLDLPLGPAARGGAVGGRAVPVEGVRWRREGRREGRDQGEGVHCRRVFNTTLGNMAPGTVDSYLQGPKQVKDRKNG